MKIIKYFIKAKYIVVVIFFLILHEISFAGQLKVIPTCTPTVNMTFAEGRLIGPSVACERLKRR